MRITTIDFETMPFDPKEDQRPDYPPTPVGVAIKRGGSRSKYYSWFHPHGGNKHTLPEAIEALMEVYESGDVLLFHNSSFDIPVWEERLGLPKIPKERIADTVPLLFLMDPHAENFQLKPSAERILEEPPDEKDELVEWLIENQPVPGIRLQRKGKKTKAEKFIAYGPVTLVGKYARGDTDRTYRLYKAAMKYVKSNKMEDAYIRDRDLIRNTLDMTQDGVCVDMKRLRRDVTKFRKAYEDTYHWVLWKLKKAKKSKGKIIVTDTEFNFNSDVQKAQALVDAGLCTAADLGVTDTGKLKSDKATLEEAISDKKFLTALRYMGAVDTCLVKSMEPWLKMAERCGGRLHPEWYITRRDEHGARSGRLASSPNMQNIPNPFKMKEIPKDLQVPALPYVRRYLVPDPGHIFIDRDYSQQELRILGHYEDDLILKAYQENPWLDFHDMVMHQVNTSLNKNYPRKHIKNINFGIVYGIGVRHLSEMMGVEMKEAKEARNAVTQMYPGIKSINTEMKLKSKHDEPLRTWGGRLYWCEPPMKKNGRWFHFEYKMLNTLIQGSAADCTKEAVNRYFLVKPSTHKVKFIIHDQVTVSVPVKQVARGMKILRECMESIEFDIPMLSEGRTGKNLEDLKDYDKKGKRV